MRDEHASYDLLVDRINTHRTARNGLHNSWDSQHLRAGHNDIGKKYIVGQSYPIQEID